jgi:hypothetical protein
MRLPRAAQERPVNIRFPHPVRPHSKFEKQKFQTQTDSRLNRNFASTGTACFAPETICVIGGPLCMRKRLFIN